MTVQEMYPVPVYLLQELNLCVSRLGCLRCRPGVTEGHGIRVSVLLNAPERSVTQTRQGSAGGLLRGESWVSLHADCVN